MYVQAELNNDQVLFTSFDHSFGVKKISVTEHFSTENHKGGGGKREVNPVLMCTGFCPLHPDRNTV